MADRYQQLVESSPGRLVAGRLGLPTPPRLRRHEPGDPVVPGAVLLGAAAGGRLVEPVARILAAVDAGVHVCQHHVEEAASRAGLAVVAHDGVVPEGPRFAALVFDASAIASPEELRAVYDFFAPVARRVAGCGRIIVLATPPEACEDPRQAIAQRALEGFTRSTGKEIKHGTTSQLVYVAPGAEGVVESTLRFLLSGRSAYVSGQVIRVGPGNAVAPDDWERPLAGRVALVTGASRGIGEAIARTLARDGAHVVCLDVPAQGQALAAVANAIGGSTLQLDITGHGAPRALADHLTERHGGVDVVVHNAGVTRDKTLGRMSEDQWDMVLDINLLAPERITSVLLEDGTLRPGGRVVCVSSISGIAGNVGQTNYATSKAGLIGLVQALAPRLAERDLTVNAVAPAFIETAMTAAMPIPTREAGRRMNSMSQGGLPVDVAETIAWFAAPASGGVNGNLVRVCGQSLLGA